MLLFPTTAILSMSENHKDCVAGLVCTKRVSTDPGCIAMAPGECAPILTYRNKQYIKCQ